MTGSRTARRWRGKGGALALAALLLGVLTEQAPHTVHHLLDPQEQAQPECEFAATDERSPGVGGLETGLDSPADTERLEARCERRALPVHALSPSPARAPPSPTS